MEVQAESKIDLLSRNGQVILRPIHTKDLRRYDTVAELPRDKLQWCELIAASRQMLLQ